MILKSSHPAISAGTQTLKNPWFFPESGRFSIPETRRFHRIVRSWPLPSWRTIMERYERILVATDFSPINRVAVERATDLARQAHSELFEYRKH
jgi:hypothetical protein